MESWFFTLIKLKDFNEYYNIHNNIVSKTKNMLAKTYFFYIKKQNQKVYAVINKPKVNTTFGISYILKIIF